MSNPSIFHSSTTTNGSYQFTLTFPPISSLRSFLSSSLESTSKTFGAFSTVLPLLLVVSTLLAAVLLRPLRGSGGAGSSFVKSPSVTTSTSANKSANKAKARIHKPSPRLARPSSPFDTDMPSPKWWIVSLLNVLLTGLFLMSIFLFFSDSSYSHYAPVIWSVCIAYFLGFFGISFIDTKELKHSPSTYGLSDLVGGAEEGGGKKGGGGKHLDSDIHPVCPQP
ncbi:hypothetical protein TrRE_jg6287, partial [Triparma retinervis]